MPAERPTQDQFVSERFPRSSKYHPDWIAKDPTGGANALWIVEWLSEAMTLRPGMRVLDLGCGNAKTSIFLAREFGVEVWAADLWTPATVNLQRIRDAGLDARVFPLHVDARSLPFAGEFFDAVVCVDAFFYFGTDALYLNYLAHFVKPGGEIGVAGAGLTQEIGDTLPEHLHEWWTQDVWSLQTADWLQRLWRRTGIVDVIVADTMPDGWRLWLDWILAIAPTNEPEIRTLQADAGRYLGYTRVVGRRCDGVKLEDYCWPDPLRSMAISYDPQPLLRED